MSSNPDFPSDSSCGIKHVILLFCLSSVICEVEIVLFCWAHCFSLTPLHEFTKEILYMNLKICQQNYNKLSTLKACKKEPKENFLKMYHMHFKIGTNVILGNSSSHLENFNFFSFIIKSQTSKWNLSFFLWKWYNLVTIIYIC